MLAAQEQQIGKVDQADLFAYEFDPRPPVGAKDRVAADRLQPLVVAHPIAREALELIQKDPLRRGSCGPITGFELQDFERHEEIESPSVALGGLDHEGLKWREVMGQAGHCRRKYAGQAQLAGQKI